MACRRDEHKQSAPKCVVCQFQGDGSKGYRLWLLRLGGRTNIFTEWKGKKNLAVFSRFVRKGVQKSKIYKFEPPPHQRIGKRPMNIKIKFILIFFSARKNIYSLKAPQKRIIKIIAIYFIKTEPRINLRIGTRCFFGCLIWDWDEMRILCVRWLDASCPMIQ